jgi:hypothetical protein
MGSVVDRNVVTRRIPVNHSCTVMMEVDISSETSATSARLHGVAFPKTSILTATIAKRLKSSRAKIHPCSEYDDKTRNDVAARRLSKNALL